MNLPLFRARTVPEILDASFQVLRAQYGKLALAGAVLLMPTDILSALFPDGAQLFGLVQRLMFMVASAATVVIVSEVYLGRDPDLGDVLRRVFRRFGSLWGAAFISGIMVVFGLLLLVVPGLIAAAWTFAMPVIVMVEGRSASESFERSRALARGNVPRILVALVLAYALFFGGAFGIGILIGMGGLVVPIGPAGETLLMSAVLVLLYPFPSVVTTLLYYDLRIRKEAFDVQMMAAELGGEVPAPPQPAWY